MTNFIQPLEPHELSSRFSNEDSLDVVPEGLDDEWREKHLEKVKDVLDKLPEDEADILEQYFFKGKKQTNIADIFDKTQAAVSYNIQRALERVRFLVNMPDVTKRQVYEDLRERGLLEDELNARIFAEMFATSCQSEVADRLDLTQGRVRHRFLSKLEDIGDELLERLHDWISGEIDDKYRRERYEEELDGLRKARKTGDIEEREFQNSLRDIRHRLTEIRDYDLGDLNRLFNYYETFVKMSHSYNILRKIDLPT